MEIFENKLVRFACYLLLPFIILFIYMIQFESELPNPLLTLMVFFIPTCSLLYMVGFDFLTESGIDILRGICVAIGFGVAGIPSLILHIKLMFGLNEFATFAERYYHMHSADSKSIAWMFAIFPAICLFTFLCYYNTACYEVETACLWSLVGSFALMILASFLVRSFGLSLVIYGLIMGLIGLAFIVIVILMRVFLGSPWD